MSDWFGVLVVAVLLLTWAFVKAWRAQPKCRMCRSRSHIGPDDDLCTNCRNMLRPIVDDAIRTQIKRERKQKWNGLRESRQSRPRGCT